MINVHDFDGSLHGRYVSTRVFSAEEQLAYLDAFIRRVSELDAQNARDACVMARAMKDRIRNGLTKDQTNDLDWANLFAEIMHHLAKTEREQREDDGIWDMLREQLSDAKRLGACPQGLSVRLLQLWLGIRP